MNRLLAALLLFAASSAAFAQANRVESLAWMAGTWVEEKGGQKITEAWVGPTNGLLVAVNLSGWIGGRTTFEYLRIADTPENMSYYASPGGKPVVEFKLKETGDKRVVFENLRHDFPQRIIYWKDGDLLAARVEGDVGGRLRSQEWRFTPLKPAGGGYSGG